MKQSESTERAYIKASLVGDPIPRDVATRYTVKIGITLTRAQPEESKLVNYQTKHIIYTDKLVAAQCPPPYLKPNGVHTVREWRDEE